MLVWEFSNASLWNSMVESVPSIWFNCFSYLFFLFSACKAAGMGRGKVHCVFIGNARTSSSLICRIYNSHPPTLLWGRQTLTTPDGQPVNHQQAVEWTCWEASFRLTPFSATRKSSFFLHCGSSWTPSSAHRQSKEDGKEKEKHQRKVRREETEERRKE